jgi:regulator of protease activity HflC (stomatin/prohibitin superfamily)
MARATRDQGTAAEPAGAWEQAADRSFKFLFLLVLLLALAWLMSNCREVPPDSRAIVLRFGTVTREASAGLLMALPQPFEQAIILPSADRQIAFKVAQFESATPQEATFPPKQRAGSAAGSAVGISPDPRENAAMLLTGDMSVVHFDARLFYQITDATAYVQSAEHVPPALERLFVASAVAIVARRDLDTILVARPDRTASSDAARAGRETLRADLLAEVNRRLASLADRGASLGIRVSRVDLGASVPAEAKPAFDSVLLALQTAQTGIAEARTRAETVSQKANQDKDRMLTDAQAQAEERVTQAKTRVAAISAFANGTPGLSGPMLSNQLFQDQVGGLLQSAGHVFAADGAGGAHLILPGGARP